MTADVAVVVPTYREAETIVDVIEQLHAALHDLDHQVLVVDDTPDYTTIRAVASEFFSDDRVHCVHRRGDGLASAVLEGFARADADVLAVCDGDGQHPASVVRTLVAKVQTGADLAVGSRYARGGSVAGDWPAHRRLISWGADTLARVLVPTARRLSDPMSGLFAVDAELIAGVQERLDPSGYKILLEVAARAPVQTVHEVGYTFGAREAGSSSLGPREYARYVHHLAALAIPDRRASLHVVDASEEEAV
jgi:dolichol-phosphate mannosyltransferase